MECHWCVMTLALDVQWPVTGDTVHSTFGRCVFVGTLHYIFVWSTDSATPEVILRSLWWTVAKHYNAWGIMHSILGWCVFIKNLVAFYFKWDSYYSQNNFKPNTRRYWWVWTWSSLPEPEFRYEKMFHFVSLLIHIRFCDTSSTLACALASSVSY